MVNAVVGAAVPFVGAFVLARRPGHRVGWVLLSTAGLGLSFLALSWSTYTAPAGLAGAAWAGWLGGWTWVPFLAMVTLLPLWFPTGRPPSPAWLPVQWWVAGLLVAIVALAMIEPRVGLGVVDNPLLAGPSWTRQAGGALTAVAVFTGLLLCLPSAAFRYRRAGADERRQQKWFLLAAVVLAGCLLLPVAQPAGDVLVGLGMVLMALAIAVAIVRHRLYDVDLLINRALVYALLTALCGGLYVGVVAGAGLVLPAGAFLLGTAAVAVAFAPLRDRLQRAADRLLYGDRRDPYRALTALARKLEANLAPQRVLVVALDEVLSALRVPFAAVVVDGEQLAAAGRPTADARDVTATPLVHRGAHLGELRVAARRAGETLGARDRVLLADLARPLGAAVHTVALTAELQRSRERLVSAREEERHRLHRDLHDGLGPTLAALVFGLGGVRHAAHRGEDVDGPVEALTAEVQAAIAEVRRVVYELRPPALDELGLAGALDRQVQSIRCAPGAPAVRLDVSGPTDELPAAVEVAVYPIVTEALTNVVRHANASTCRVHVALDGRLNVEVVDDGSGLPDPVSCGAGLRSLRERAAELGGTCSIARGPVGGTVVRAELPVTRG
ncbi:MAG: histidine kinase [Pseudonocardia sp.]